MSTTPVPTYMAYTWTVYAVHPGEQGLRNSVVEMQLPGDTPEEALANLEFIEDVIADHEGALFFVVREDHVPGRDGEEVVSHDHGLFKLNTDPHWDRV